MGPRSTDRDYDEWLVSLRLRLSEVARRRVRPSDLEDVVQEALRVIHARGFELGTEDTVDGLPPVAWCFQVLRNTIGNHYKRVRRREGVMETGVELDQVASVAADAPTPAEALESDQVVACVRGALDDLAGSDPGCHASLRAVMDGVSVRDLASRAGVTEPVFSRRLYRCRQKLRLALRAKGILP